MKWFTILFWKTYKIEKIGHSWYSDFYLFLMISRAVFWQDSQIQITHKITIIHNILTFQIKLVKVETEWHVNSREWCKILFSQTYKVWADCTWLMQWFLFILNVFKNIIVDSILKYESHIKSSKCDNFWTKLVFQSITKSDKIMTSTFDRLIQNIIYVKIQNLAD